MNHLFLKAKVKVTQSCLTLCDLIDYMVHGILQARILEWVAIPFSSGSSGPKNRTRSPALQVDSLPAELLGKPICFYMPVREGNDNPLQSSCLENPTDRGAW